MAAKSFEIKSLAVRLVEVFGEPVRKVCEFIGVSEQAIYKWLKEHRNTGLEEPKLPGPPKGTRAILSDDDILKHVKEFPHMTQKERAIALNVSKRTITRRLASAEITFKKHTTLQTI